MYNNDDIFNYLSGKTTTETETDTARQTYADTTSSSKTDDNYGYSDDYSVAQNFKEETGYNTTETTDSENDNVEQRTFRSINAPVIQRTKKEETVTLTKTREVLKITGRMKIVAAMFLVIMASLIAVIAWNFSAAGRINANLAEKQAIINQLQLSINNLQEEYNVLGDDGNLKDLAENAGFVEANDTNTVTITLDEMYVKNSVQEVPSNWFNDVCEFFSKIFAWKNSQTDTKDFVDVWRENGS